MRKPSIIGSLTRARRVVVVRRSDRSMNMERHALPNREHALFTTLVDCYESKKYAEGVEAADRILAKFPDHGETLAMKGLVVRSMDESHEVNAEARALVKRGIECHPSSHVCWHVLGLVHRAERNHAESAKCYAQALKMDSENGLIMKDLSIVYLQTRNFKAFVDLRWKILGKKPDQRASYASLACGLHLLGEHDSAYDVIDTYEKVRASNQFDHPRSWVDEDPLMKRFDASELTLFKATAKKAGGKHKEALALLEREEANVVDRVAYLTLLGELQVELGMMSAAEETYWKLIDRLPDSYDYHKALRIVKGLPEHVHDGTGEITDDDVAKLKALYEEIASKVAYCASAKRLPLSFTKPGDEFKALVGAYVEKPLRKGVPSLFEDLKNLYENPEKAAIMEDVFKGIVESLKSSGTFPSGGSTSSDDEKKECTMYAVNLLAMHYDEMGQRAADGGAKEFGKALELIEEAISMDASCVELHLNKASFLAHAGDLQGAADAAETSRKLDLADRFLNSNCVGHMMRAGRYAYAEELAAMFARDGDPATNLFDMEATWFELEAAKCHTRRNKFGRALKYYHAVLTHFNQFVEDQFDFHAYCLRRTSINAYMDLLKVEDSMYARDEFRAAAKGAVMLYVNLFDEPPAEKAAALEAKIAAMSADEAQKFREQIQATKEREEKEERARLAALEEAKKVAAAQESKNKSPKEDLKKEDPDPYGDAYENDAEPLEQAMKFVEPLQMHAAQYEETHLLAFEVFIRQGKPILALKAVNEALKINSESYQAKANVARLAHVVETMDEANAMKKVMAMQVGKLTENKSPAAFLDTLDSRTSPVSAAAVALAKYGVTGDAAALAASAGSTSVDASRYSLAEYVEAHEMYATVSKAAADALKAACAGAFVHSTVFGGAKATVRTDA